jgi:hypothetical protein
MKPLSRRRAIKLATTFLTAPLLRSAGRAQPASGTGPTVFEMANFFGPGVDADAAFAKAIAAISKVASDAARAGGPVHIVFNLGKNAIYRINRPLAFKAINGFELNGNGAQLINTTRGSTLAISACSHVTIRDLTIDYDPLPFTQGTIAADLHGRFRIVALSVPACASMATVRPCSARQQSASRSARRSVH